MFHINILTKIILITSSLLFLGSITFPFIHGIYAPLMSIPERVYYEVDFWSFKGRYVPFLFTGHHGGIIERWFYDYWSFDYFLGGFGPSWILIVIFLFQIFTLISAILSIFTKRIIVAVVPAILCPIVTAFMIYLSFYQTEIYFIFLRNFELGYWLTYASEVAFIINLILKVKSR